MKNSAGGVRDILVEGWAKRRRGDGGVVIHRWRNPPLAQGVPRYPG